MKQINENIQTLKNPESNTPSLLVSNLEFLEHWTEWILFMMYKVLYYRSRTLKQPSLWNTKDRMHALDKVDPAEYFGGGIHDLI
jgi:hypothetical protein